MNGEKILVIDDVKIEVVALEEELSQEGYEVDTALSGQEALEMVKSKKYDLIFIDLVMPGMDGIQTCKAIKKIIPDTVSIFFTGKVSADTTKKEIDFINAGGEIYYLYKPFAEGEILETAKKALAEKG